MLSFRRHISEQVKIDGIESLKTTIEAYKKAGEILNPEYVRLTDSAKKLFRKVSDSVQKHALDLLHNARQAKEDESIVQEFYYSISDSFAGLGKLQKMAEKNKNSTDSRVKSVVAEVNNMILVWKPIADDLKGLKDKVVKVSQKRAEVKATAAADMGRKFSDSSSLISIFEEHLEEYKKGAKDRATEFINNRLEVLKKADWDLNKVVPRTKSGYGDDFKTAEAKRSLYNSITKGKGTSRKPDEPDIREPNHAMIEHFIKQSVQAAEDDYRAFMQKMIVKIGKPVVKAKMTGSIWTNAIITVETDDGEEQIWNTQMIINFSKYQKMFNQFPSRRKK
jgi:hypothetical protein